MKTIDFRSDTVTQPTLKMREAMMNAEVGDDILGEDKTVKQLEEYAAKLFKRDSAMFVVSGTMANQIAIMTMTNRGEEVILSKNSHMYNLEVAGLATLSQVQVRPLGTNQGRYDLHELKKSIRARGIQNPKTAVIALENTYNLNEGLALPVDYFREIKALSKENNLYTYLDGARLFNAAVATNSKLSDYSVNVDALQVCLTKGLAAPIGSLLIGDGEFINKARWMRQRIGGGMRQAGHMAAAGYIALSEMRDRIKKDHINAKHLAHNLKNINDCLINLNQVQTNILNINLKNFKLSAIDFSKELLKENIKVKVVGENNCRLVTHKDITKSDIDYTTQTIKNIINKSKL
ncbi:MAG: GntG family PLP-dependent aldolase [Clostridia bacterium]